MPDPIEENPLMIPPNQRKYRRYQQGTGTVHRSGETPANAPPSGDIEAAAAQRADPTVERALQASLNAMGRMMSEMPTLEAQENLIHAMDLVRQALVRVAKL